MADAVRTHRTFGSRRTKLAAVFLIVAAGALAFSLLFTFPRLASDIKAIFPKVVIPHETTGIVWNTWTSRDGEPFSPAERLATEADSLVTLHLSSFDYGKWS